MFKLKPVAEAIFEGFLQRIVSIETFQWTPYLPGTTFASNSTFLTGAFGQSSSIEVQTRRFVTQVSRVSIETPPEVQDELESAFPVEIGINYTSSMGFSAQNLSLYPDDPNPERFLQATPSSEFVQWSTFRVTATYRFNRNYYLTDVFDPTRNLQTLYTYNFRMDRIPTITPLDPAEDLGQGIPAIQTELDFTIQRPGTGNSRLLAENTYPLREGVLTPAVGSSIVYITHTPTNRVLRIQNVALGTPVLEYVYENRDEPLFACTINGAITLLLPPELFAPNVDLSEYTLSIDMPTTSYNSLVWERPTVEIPSNYVTGVQDRAWFTWVFDQNDPPRRSGYELQVDDVSSPVHSTVGDFAESTWVAKYNRQLQIHNSLTTGSMLFTPPINYNALNVARGTSINGNAQIQASFFYPDDNDATFRSAPLNSRRVRYDILPLNNGGLTVNLFAVANRNGQYHLERVPAPRGVSFSLSGIMSVYSGQYGNYNFTFDLDSTPLFLDNAPAGQSITKIRLIYDLENETRTENVGSASTSVTLSAPFSILGTVTDSSGTDLEEITLITYRQLISRFSQANDAPSPIRSHGYNNLVREGIDEETGQITLADLIYLPMSSTNANITYSDIGAFLYENIQALTLPPAPQQEPR